MEFFIQTFFYAQSFPEISHEIENNKIEEIIPLIHSKQNFQASTLTLKSQHKKKTREVSESNNSRHCSTYTRTFPRFECSFRMFRFRYPFGMLGETLWRSWRATRKINSSQMVSSCLIVSMVGSE